MTSDRSGCGPYPTTLRNGNWPVFLRLALASQRLARSIIFLLHWLMKSSFFCGADRARHLASRSA